MSLCVHHVQSGSALVQVEVIELYNDGSGLGFGIVGSKGIGVIIKTIIPGGVSARVSVVKLCCNFTLSVLSATSSLSKKVDALDNWCLRRILQMKRFGLALDNHSCLTQSVDVACLSSDISVVPIPVMTIPELFSHAFWVLPETGVIELVDRDNLG